MAQTRNRPAGNGTASQQMTGGDVATIVAAEQPPTRWRRVEVDHGRGWSVVAWVRAEP